jgi:putative colanic acid biosynthesis UDP-glucose lipid carrier transferase
LADLKPFVMGTTVDEIYCSLNEISNWKLKDLIDFADENKNKIHTGYKEIFQELKIVSPVYL